MSDKVKKVNLKKALAQHSKPGPMMHKTFRFETELVEKLEAEARKHKLKLSDLVRAILKEAVKSSNP